MPARGCSRTGSPPSSRVWWRVLAARHGAPHVIHSGLRLLGRMHDAIKTGGYKVMAQEVEVALRERGITGEFVVLGLPSKYWVEVISCVRAGNDERWIDEMKKASEPLTRYKQPRLFVTVPTIWKNATGKIDRTQIRNFIDTHYELQDGSHPVLRRRD